MPAKAIDTAPQLVAIYDVSTRTIHLPPDWTGATPAELSILVHEMVHHMQAAAGLRFACPAARERQAYAAQERWLDLFDQTLEETFQTNRLFVKLATTCSF